METVLLKRITTCDYLSLAHGGALHWLNTIHLAPALLALLPPARTDRLLVLSLSLSPLLRIETETDYLEQLASLLDCYARDKPSRLILHTSVPFALDYRQVLYATLDLITQTYRKLLDMGATRVELVRKIDERLHKLLSAVVKDLDRVARTAAKDELARLLDQDLDT